jgi:hypothetical protein
VTPPSEEREAFIVIFGEKRGKQILAELDREEAAYRRLQVETIGGYAKGVGEVLASPAVLTYHLTGTVLYGLGVESHRETAESFFGAAEAVAEKGPVGTLVEGVTSQFERIKAAYERGDAFEMGAGGGNLVGQVAVATAGTPKVNVTAAPALATAEGVVLQAGRTTVAVTGGPSTVAAGIWLSSNAGTEATTVQENTPNKANQSPTKQEPAKAARGGRGPVEKGRLGVEKSKAEALARGERLAGEEVTFELPSGRRTRSDVVTRIEQEQLKVREAKEGPTARLTEGQKEMQGAAAQGKAVIPRGKKAKQAGLTPGQPVKIKEFEEDRFPH